MPAPRKPDKEPSLVAYLAAQAAAKPVNNILSIQKYYTSAHLLIRQADDYRLQHNDEQQYVMLMRYASLVLETIPQHKSFAKTDPGYASLKKALAERYFPLLEKLKLELATKDAAFMRDPVAYSRNRPADAQQMATSNLPGVNWGPGSNASGSPSGLPAPASAAPVPQVNVDDLLDILQHGTGPPTRPAALPPAGQAGAPATSASSALSTTAPPPVYQPKYAASSSAAAHSHSLFFSSTSFGDSRGTGSQGAYTPSQPTYPSYPTAPSAGAASQQQQQALPRYPGLDDLRPLQPPALPQPQPSAGPSLGPQEIGVITVSPDTSGLPHTCTPSAPPLPPGQTSGYGPPPPQPQQQPPPPPPPPPQPQAQSGPSGPKELVKRQGLRDVHVSVALMEEFLAYARANTSRGIESCGILAGRLSANDSIFTITTLIIPKQTGTTDTVAALNEEEIFEVQFSQELYPLGWIHTHPTQTCFLSSVDVHTHCGYQTMLDEAVAIVMAPTDRSRKCGIFRLSTPGGLQLVQRCGLRGFHAHPDTSTGQDLYELCGHVYLNPRAKHSVIDLR
uniref:MPN domain-containing protein n=1 Tax=Chlamydomonas leiostraca TaxID=1034604 RepID=A0A7S0R6C5_9CHLO|mmetsp:Transcript_14921/g.37223  ORF Transcript_14921/g.37223 Transcript_14921/m.37223 type:complete len:562 (+) Transcript_14921:161-1846(+)|eukprot:CAMPEP_0202866090 /NCGR_PEP_ID=MMETSP1391-20130828/7196_1 /ASSEMBLY_ACC=CAM_ASM_000867 /TAXON_ID=1034604 /ORGANISM="Chlamydomonas leiostraca, Strain SAG 11-49" /LENGTH=561 /DNA_ID=CAMNT_0049546009 /DNA_START=147 /DNA_END=1832 /DNA_ORIENTATION=-